MFQHHEAIRKAKQGADQMQGNVHALFRGEPGSFQTSAIDQHLRMLDLQDEGSRERAVWFELVARVDQFHPDKQDDWRYLAQAGPRFRLLLIGGNDPAVMEERLRLAREVLPNKVLVAVINRCDAKDVARLLQSGADDVFRIGMDPLEARARLQGMLRRDKIRSMGQAPLLEASQQSWQAGALASRYGLSQTEGEMLAILLARRDQLVPYSALHFEQQDGCETRSRKSLTVRVHHLRSKVADDWVIHNVRRHGYILKAAGSGEKDS